MSQENVDGAYRAYDAFSRGDWEALVELIDPAVEFESLILEADGASYRGHEGVREYFEIVHDVFSDWHSEITELRDFGDTLIIESHAVGTAKGSGIELGQRFWQAVRLRDGKIVWWRFVRTEEEALEAVGLRE
jgi:ketosteroid isomerase-like protein